MSFYINVPPPLIMRIVEYKNRLNDKINVGVNLGKKSTLDMDLKSLLENLEDLEGIFKDQMGIGLIPE